MNRRLLKAAWVLSLVLAGSCSQDTLLGTSDTLIGQSDIGWGDLPADLDIFADTLDGTDVQLPDDLLADLPLDETELLLPETFDVTKGDLEEVADIADIADIADTDTTPNCDCKPPTLSLTVNDIPPELNGSLPFLNADFQEQSFYLALPTFGFLWNLQLDCPCGCPEGSLVVTTSQTVGDLPADNNLAGNFASTGTPGSYVWRVPEDHSFAPGEAAFLFAQVEDVCGFTASAEPLQVAFLAPTPQLLPFDIEDPWLFVHSRDFMTITTSVDNAGTHHLDFVTEPNGIPDFQEDLWALGLGTANPTAEFADVSCAPFHGGNECLVFLVLNEVRKQNMLFFGCPEGDLDSPDCPLIRFYIEGEVDAPNPSDFQYETLDGSESTRHFSMIGFGGRDPDGPYFGYSESVDFRNDGNEDNARFAKGVFSTMLLTFLYNSVQADPSLYNLLELLAGEFVPLVGGTPLGELPGDELVVDPTVPATALEGRAKSRKQLLSVLLELGGLGLGALTSHEIGHSVGLVPKGAPPHGFFAAEQNAAFIEKPEGSVGWHIDTAGFNLMQSGPGSGNDFQLSAELLQADIAFNPLNLAYLRGQVLLLP